MEYYSLNQYLRDIFGCKVYKLSLDAGLTCPNRDGTLDSRGCIFCSAGGSGEFAVGRTVIRSLGATKSKQIPCSEREEQKGEAKVLSVQEQLELAKSKVVSKVKEGSCKYIAYFQAFTNTYGPIEYLEKMYMEAIAQEDIVALSIATRPDCLGEEVLDLLQRLNGIKPVWVELGLQTIHEQTAKYIRRGYPLEVFDEAVIKLRKIGVEVIVHVILGLPGESKEQILQTVQYVGESDVQGIKLQLLHVLEGTDLAKEYREGKVPVMTLEEYASLVADCIAILPKEMVIHRMTGDGDKKLLIAPKWSEDKKRVLNMIQKSIREK